MMVKLLEVTTVCFRTPAFANPCSTPAPHISTPVVDCNQDVPQGGHGQASKNNSDIPGTWGVGLGGFEVFQLQQIPADQTRPSRRNKAMQIWGRFLVSRALLPVPAAPCFLSPPCPNIRSTVYGPLFTHQLRLASSQITSYHATQLYFGAPQDITTRQRVLCHNRSHDDPQAHCT